MPDPKPIAGVEVGRLTVPVAPGPVRCGIHRTVIVGGRCVDCDQDEGDRKADLIDDAWREASHGGR